MTMTLGRSLGLCLSLCLLWAGCTEQTQGEETAQQLPADTSSAMTASSDSLNMLTQAERQNGWQLLFDGDSLSAWRGFNQQAVPQGWTAQNGAIYFDGEGEGDLITKDQYDNFELSLDWKIAEGGNSGILYNVSEEYESVAASGPEYQLIDAENYQNEVSDVQQSASNYALYAPTADVVRPAGQWNEARIVIDGDRVEHWLNGEQVVEYEIGSEEWKKRVANSKFADWEGYAQSEAGHLALQNHGHPVWFRNIKIRPLDQQPSS